SEPETLFEPPGAFAIDGLSPDMRFATGVSFEANKTTGYDIFLVDLVRRTARPWRVTPRNETMPCISPDGAWVAFIDRYPEVSRLTLARLDNPARTWEVTQD